MTYKEYEKRVVELLLEDCKAEDVDFMMEKIEAELKDEPNFLQMSYGYDCFDYDPPEIYGDVCKKTFEDEFLKKTPVANFRKLL